MFLPISAVLLLHLGVVFCHEDDTTLPKDCADLYMSGHRRSNVYTIWYDPYKKEVEVYCDMETEGGGWTVFQRRYDGFVDFYRTWKEYAEGFGDPRGEFWLGNHVLYHLTNQKPSSLRIDMADFEKAERYAEYRYFRVGDPAQHYKLEVDGYRGNAGDSFSAHSGMQFTTKDQDNDIRTDDKNCAKMYKGGWWYSKCHSSNLNGLYLRGPHTSFADGINWRAWHDYYYSLKFTEMKIRPLDF